MPSAPTSRDFREGTDVELFWVAVGGWAVEGWVQLPSPREVRMEERDLG